MKKIIAFLLSVIIAYTPTLIFAGVDDPNYDWNKHVQTGNWTHNKVTPYNTAGSTQSDYFNSSKYNVNSSRDVTSNGSKYKQTVNVAVEASKAEKAATIANRAKNMADYAKKLGKASIPAFVGSAALTALINGVGWVMDEGGKVTKKPDAESEENLEYTSQSIYTARSFGCTSYSVESALSCVAKWHINNHSSYSGYTYNGYSAETDWYDNGRYRAYNIRYSNSNLNKDSGVLIQRSSNPNYNPDYVQQPVEVPLDEMADLLQKAMDKSLADNNQALASAIAQSIKEAFSESDLDKNPNTGEKNNPIAEKTKKALDEKGAAEITEDADPTVCVPNIGDLDGSCTNMPKSEADALPTLQCVNRPIISANHCVYEVDPNAPSKPGTIEKPKVNPETGELPEACVWFDVHCKWIEWTKEKPDQDTTDTEVQEKERSFDFDIFKKDRFTVSRQCPAPVEHTIELSGISTSFSFDLTPLCDVLEMARPALVACSYLYAAYIVIGAARNG
jgi:hypothetical protein